MGDAKAEVLQGTLDLLVLKTLEALGAMHGWELPAASSRYRKTHSA